jgi:hypothetical protein
MRWKVGIGVAFAIVLLVNAAFIAVAVSGADTVVASYGAESR